MDKTVHIGNAGNGEIFCSIKYNDGRLSITGVEGPKRNGDCVGACGQIVMGLKQGQHTIKPAKGWDYGMIERFFDAWDRWHLNDLRAGTPAQETFLRNNPIADRVNYYTAACEALAAVGLNPDNGYKYGSAWLREEVPQDVLDWLAALPNTDVKPAWV